jgi:pimeloyl-ACP methyl ester carboxylesterase
MRLKSLIIFMVWGLATLTHAAQRQTQVIRVDGHNLQYTQWSSANNTVTTPTLVLLSGPNDNWNSDSTWFARLAPKLSHEFKVIAVDRAGIGLAQAHAPLGYAHFGTDLKQLIEALDLDNIHVIAFASSNISLLHYFNQAPADDTRISSVILIDPDVLTDFSIKRYAKDAYPFKKNQKAYVEYIKQGKYLTRAKQKNQMELEQLQRLAGEDPDVDWAFIKEQFIKRLTTQNLVNLFSEIAIYEQDLSKTKGLNFPKSLKMMVLDTDFEAHFIDQAENKETKQGLVDWQADAKRHYQNLVAQQSYAKYEEMSDKEHLLMFSQPNLIIKQIKQLVNTTK